MVYAPRQGNDRLLLGLKGSLNEYELDLLRQRSVEARREKARRGELLIFHHRVQTTGFQPVSFSSKMRHRRCRAWTTGTEVIRSIRLSTTSYG